MSDSRIIPMTTKKTYKSMLRIADFAFIPPSSDDAEVSDETSEGGKFHLWEGMSKVKQSAFTFVVRFNVSVPLELVVFYENAMYQELIKEEYTCYERAAYARASRCWGNNPVWVWCWWYLVTGVSVVLRGCGGRMVDGVLYC